MNNKDKDLEMLEEVDEPVQIVDDEGKINEFYPIGEMEFEGKTYVFFQPAESVEGADPDDVVIFELGEENYLLPVEDDDLLDRIFAQFEAEYYSEYAQEGEEDLLN